MKKTKKQRQAWWNSLSPDEQGEQIARWQSRKHERRLAKSRQIMKKSGLKHDCKQCIHGMTQSCTDNLERGCEYFYKAG